MPLPLFTRPDDKRLGRAQVSRAFHKARIDAGLKWTHPHDLRHPLTMKMVMSRDLFAVMASPSAELVSSTVGAYPVTP